MERKEFQAWLSAVDTLSEAQKAAAVEILAGRPVGEASSELRFGARKFKKVHFGLRATVFTICS